MSKDTAAHVLVVDRDSKMGRELGAFLKRAGYAVERVGESEKAFNLVDSRPFNALILDLQSGPLDGMRLVAVARARTPDICIVLAIDERQTALATAAMKQGVSDFQVKPLNLEKVEAVLAQGLERQRLMLEAVSLKRRLDERFGLANLVGHSRLMAHVYNAVRQAGPSDVPVLIVGEPGTGKEVVAQALHHSGPRRDESFVKLDCRGLSGEAVERELFGEGDMEEGGRLRGRFELADGGTLYIEGVDKLPLAAQRKILAVLNAGRVGEIPVNVRLICAAHSGLDALSSSGALLPEFARKAGQVSIEAPALRRRPEDIAPLVSAILDRNGARQRGIGIAREALDVFEEYAWPDNVRELEAVVSGMAASAPESALLGAKDIPGHIRHACAPPSPEEMRFATGAPLAAVERAAIEATLRACGGNKEKCAKTLCIGLRTLYRKLEQYSGS